MSINERLRTLRTRSIEEVAVGLTDICMELLVERSALKKILNASRDPINEVLEEYLRCLQDHEETGHANFALRAKTASKLFDAHRAISEYDASPGKIEPDT